MREVARLRLRTKLSRRRSSTRIGQCSFFFERHGEDDDDGEFSVAAIKTLFYLSDHIPKYFVVSQ